MKIFNLLVLSLIFLIPGAFAFEDCNKMKGEERQICRIANNLEIIMSEQKQASQLSILKIQAYKESKDACQAIDSTLQRQFKIQESENKIENKIRIG